LSCQFRRNQICEWDPAALGSPSAVTVTPPAAEDAAIDRGRRRIGFSVCGQRLGPDYNRAPTPTLYQDVLGSPTAPRNGNLASGAPSIGKLSEAVATFRALKGVALSRIADPKRNVFSRVALL
jgi:hypothetical protein